MEAKTKSDSGHHSKLTTFFLRRPLALLAPVVNNLSLKIDHKHQVIFKKSRWKIKASLQRGAVKNFFLSAKLVVVGPLE